MMKGKDKELVFHITSGGRDGITEEEQFVVIGRMFSLVGRRPDTSQENLTAY